jgi:hypothetical protein
MNQCFDKLTNLLSTPADCELCRTGAVGRIWRKVQVF